jgi:hypothetical protein
MITINMDKAKAIGHQLRRAQREAEFAPLDAIISKQIPGADYTAAETSRQAIRDKYALVQDAIDDADNADEIKVAFDIQS